MRRRKVDFASKFRFAKEVNPAEITPVGAR